MPFCDQYTNCHQEKQTLLMFSPNHSNKRVLHTTFLSPPPGMWLMKSNDPHFDRARSRKCSMWFSIYTPI